MLPLIAIIILLVGCGELKINSYTVIDEKGSGELSFKVIYDDIIEKNINGSILEENNTRNSKIAKKYMKDNKNVEEILVKFNNIEELKNNKELEKEDFIITINEDKRLTKSRYTYEMKFKNPINESTISKRLNKKDSLTVSSNIDQSPIDDYLNKVVFNNYIQIPGKIVSTNAIETDGNILKWSYYLGQITPDTVMTATYEVENTQNKTMAWVVSGVILLLVIWYFYKTRKRAIT